MMSRRRIANAAHRYLALLLLGLPAHVALGADPGAPAVAGKERAVTLESVAGSPIKRVVLSAKAAERLDVKTGTVSEQTIVPTQWLGASVVDPSAAGSAPRTPAATDGGKAVKAGGALWIRIVVSPAEWNRLAKDKPVRVLPIETRPSLAKDLVATPTGQPPQELTKSGMLSLFYTVPADHGGLVIGDRVRVEMPLEAGTEKQKVVPYSAVYYDAKGDAWVYVSTAPLAFHRERVEVERVSGDLALLASGPAVGTPVATVGVSLLYGAEIFGK